MIHILRRWFCWRGKPGESKGFVDLDRICRCAFMVEWHEIGFRLLRWGKENKRFSEKYWLSTVMFYLSIILIL